MVRKGEGRFGNPTNMKYKDLGVMVQHNTASKYVK